MIWSRICWRFEGRFGYYETFCCHRVGICGFSGGTAWAQPGNPAVMAPGTPKSAPGMPAPHQPNQPDRLSVREAAIGGMAEVSAGKLASQKGGAPSVREFGQRMVTDHSKANDQLANLARADNIPLPDMLDPEHQSIYERLEKLRGAEFDSVYIAAQIQDHQRTIQLLEYEIGSGQDPDLKAFASQTLPIVIQHLQMAQALQAQLAGHAV